LHRTLRYLGENKTTKTNIILGYTKNELLERITAHPNWEIVKDETWEIDHIFPIKAFIEHDIFDVKVINALDNLQPLTKLENGIKSGIYDKDEFFNYLINKYGSVEIVKNKSNN
jgi:hypothetical protein